MAKRSTHTVTKLLSEHTRDQTVRTDNTALAQPATVVSGKQAQPNAFSVMNYRAEHPGRQETNDVAFAPRLHGSRHGNLPFEVLNVY